MCDDDEHPNASGSGPPRLSRRTLLQGMVALTALAGCTTDGPPRAATTPALPSPTVPLAPRAPSADRLAARVVAMHLHASASEGEGSVHAHLRQAATHGYDVAWFTEHDWRRRRLLFRSTYSFVPGEVQHGGAWELRRRPDAGAVDSNGSGVVPSPVSPTDPGSPKARLRRRARSTGGDAGSVAWAVDARGGSRTNYRSRMAGRQLKLDVLVTAAGPDAWGEVLLSFSYHPAIGRRPAGVYALRYRLRTDVRTRTASIDGLTGVVDVPVDAGGWQELVLDPVTDLAEIYPDMDARDHSLHDIVFRGVCRAGAQADVCVGHLRLEEQDGYDAVGVEQDLVARYAGSVPEVLGVVGSEISLGPHVNQYGGEQSPYEYGPVRRFGDKPRDEAIPSIVDHIHAAGGLASISHPGVAVTALLAQRTAADMVEVGFGRSGPEGIVRQLAFWDTLSRNGLFLTGNGAADDHSGQGWDTKGNRYYTAAWTGELTEGALLDAFGRGRAYVGYLGSFGGTVDMALDDGVPMGAVVVGAPRRRSLRVDVTGLPDGGAVQVVRGVVDRAGTADPTPGTSVVRTLGVGDLAREGALPLDVDGDCFHRLQVTDRSGAVVAYGQPIWLLAQEPPGGVPDHRRAGRTTG
jgi:hypothetical protein